MAITVNVTCPVCRAGLTYEHKEDGAWGTIGLTDFAIVELTAHDGGQLREHMMTHYEDGTWAGVVRQQAEASVAFAERLDELGK